MHSCIRRPRPIVARGVVAVVVVVVAGEVEVAVVEDIADIADNLGEVAGTWFLSKPSAGTKRWHVSLDNCSSLCIRFDIMNQRAQSYIHITKQA